jgi:alanine dehydrogenase
MRVGTLREIKNHEYRVGLTPESVRELAAQGHEVLVEAGAGRGIGASDSDYEAAGGTIGQAAADIFAACELIVKVKEPQAGERAMLREGQVLFTYLHLAPDPEQTADLVKSGVTAIAYETVTGPGGSLPLLKPMSQVAGRMSVQAGASALEKEHGGRGILLGGVPGVLPGKVAVIGGGVVGFNAAQVAVGMGADVTILDREPEALERLGVHFESRAKTRFSNRANIADCIAGADLVIGAVLVPGAAAPKLVTRAMLATMKPGAVARTSTYALNNVTLPHVLAIAERGWKAALQANPNLAAGLNIHVGKVTHEAVALELGYETTPLDVVLG